VAEVLNEETPSPEPRDFDSGKEGQSTLTSDESQNNTLCSFQNDNRDWANSTGGEGFGRLRESSAPAEMKLGPDMQEGFGRFRENETLVERFGDKDGGPDLKPSMRGAPGLSVKQKEKIQMQLNVEKNLMKRQIHQQLMKQQQERDDQHRLQQQQEQQLFRRQEVERQYLYLQVGIHTVQRLCTRKASALVSEVFFQWAYEKDHSKFNSEGKGSTWKCELGLQGIYPCNLKSVWLQAAIASVRAKLETHCAKRAVAEWLFLFCCYLISLLLGSCI
jgi:hypothetical protein